MSLGPALANKSNAATRRKLDLYPTPPDVTHALMKFLAYWRNWTIWEPAAGDGAMARVLAEYNNTVIATDIATGTDFLETERTCDAIVTNPPFYLSEDFILHALECAPNVAMVLKSQYWHAARRLSLFRQNPPAYVLPLTWRPDFDGRGAPTMEVLWTVWTADRRPRGTEYLPLERPK